MRLAETRISEEKERIERRLSGIHRNGTARRHRQLVAFAFHEVAEAIDAVQVRVDVHSGDSRNYKRTRIGRSRVAGQLNGFVWRRVSMRCRELDVRLGSHRSYPVNELSVCTYLSLEHFHKHVEEVGFQILPEELGRHFDCDGVVHHRNCLQRLEPGIVRGWLHDVLKHLETPFPYLYMSVCRHLIA